MPPRRPSIPNEIRACLVAPLERLGGLDEFDLLLKSNDAIAALTEAQHEVGLMRRRAVRELRAQGYLLKEIAERLDVKPQRIHQIESGYDRAEKRDRARRAR
jgi:DNA-binding NarL/FixJ family response regulator